MTDLLIELNKMSSDDLVAVVLSLILAAAFMFLPWIIAKARNHHDSDFIGTYSMLLWPFMLLYAIFSSPIAPTDKAKDKTKA